MKKTMLAFLAFASVAACGLYADEMVNLAKGATATASSSQSAEYAPGKAIDGRGNTRWSSKRNDNEWFMLDLGQPKTVGQIRLDWEAAAGRDYVVQFSNDGKTFTDVYTVTNGKKGAREIIRIKPRETRYIRILGRKRASQFGYSLWEMMVYPAVDNLAFGAKATASSTERKLVPGNAVDGRNDTRWGSERRDNEWLMLDLGAAKTVGKLVLRWEQAAGKEYAVQFSQDGKNFTEVFRKKDGKSGAVETIRVKPQNTRYIRIQGVKRTTPFGYSLWEVEAYAK